MDVRLASTAAPDGTANEDYIVALPQLVGVFDGVTASAAPQTGWVHGPAWYVRRLATHLARRYVAAPQEALPELLARAIQDVRPEHDGQCDLSHPGTPASTVTLLHQSAGSMEYLVLRDSPLVIDRGEAVQVLTDERHVAAIAHLGEQPLTSGTDTGTLDHAARPRRLIATHREYTHRPGGSWIAAADPHAAYQSRTRVLPLTGTDRVRRAALLTNGASSAIDQFGLLDWPGLLDLLTNEGPRALVGRVREADPADPEAGQRLAASGMMTLR